MSIAEPVHATPLRPRLHGSSAGQKGVVMVIALIVLVALMLASISLVRSVDTANVIAGNLAFKQASVQASDFGIEAAAAALPDIIATTVEEDVISGTATYWYYATRRETDANGVPTTKEAGSEEAGAPINWAQVPVARTVGGNVVKVVIDRLCTGPAPVNDVAANCFHESLSAGGTKKIGGTVFSTVTMVYYRVTAQVTGPRNTVTLVQAIIGR